MRTLCDKNIKIFKRSNRWWDNELSNQLKKTRRVRKGKAEEGINQEGRVRKWKIEQEKMRSMVRGKKKECWKQFREENREKDPW